MTETPLAPKLDLPRGPAWPNRIALAPLTNQQSHDDGTLSDEEYRWLTMRAEGGFGLTMTCAAYVQPNGKGFPGQLGVASDAHLPGLVRLADAIRAAGSVSSVQIYHGGIRADRGGVSDIVGASEDEETGARAMTTAEVEEVRDNFVAAAIRAEKAGFDGVAVHGAHGYLITQFLSAETNRRTDRYGGSLENRERLLWEVLDGIRAACGPQFQLGLRLSPERFGLKLAEIRDLAARLLAREAVDYLDMSLWDAFKEPEEAEFKGRTLGSVFTELPRGRVRLGAAGNLRTAAAAASMIEAGFDFAMIGRGAIVNHDFARRALADADYAPPALPVPASLLAEEGVSPVFLEYLRSFRDFVAEE